MRGAPERRGHCTSEPPIRRPARTHPAVVGASSVRTCKIYGFDVSSTQIGGKDRGWCARFVRRPMSSKPKHTTGEDVRCVCTVIVLKNMSVVYALHAVGQQASVRSPPAPKAYGAGINLTFLSTTQSRGVGDSMRLFCLNLQSSRI